MSEHTDYLLALELQRQFDAEQPTHNSQSFGEDEIQEVDYKPATAKSSIHPRSNLHEDFLNRTQNLVHPQWEIVDPTPDVFSMFSNFDDKFFQGRLKCVTLEWSKRMYSCAGICYSRRTRLGMDVTIRLSEPLLKLRSRKDLVETMLHEMIHAYCFVLNIREGNGGHGPNFKKIMYAINQVAGTNITVYHTFHDEVENYKTHVWRCNGICQNRKPFFGYVRRTCNRAPSANDQWWAAHQASCGGTFMKIQQPEKPKKNKKTKEKQQQPAKQVATNDLRNYFGNKQPQQAQQQLVATINLDVPPTSYPGLSTAPFKSILPASNVVGFGDLQNRNTAAAKVSMPTGRGYVMQAKTSTPTKAAAETAQADHQHVRAIWSKRFETTNSSLKRSHDDIEVIEPVETASVAKKACVEQSAQWQVIDDDVMLREPVQEIVSISSSDDETDFEDASPTPATASIVLTGEERERAIKREIINDSDHLKDEDIQLIDDEYDDELDTSTAAELADTALIDELFGEDTLLKDFQMENDVVPSSSSYQRKAQNDIIKCPICQDKMKRSELENHLNGCTGMREHIRPSLASLQNMKKMPEAKKPQQSRYTKKTKKQQNKDLLLQCGYTETELANLNVSLNSSKHSSGGVSAEEQSAPEQATVAAAAEMNDEHRLWRQRSIYSTKRQCPVCAQEIEELQMNEHLDACLLLQHN